MLQKRILNISILLIAFNLYVPMSVAADKKYVPEKGSVEQKKKKKAKGPKYDVNLPNVLIIGDSISMGYTPFIKNALTGKVNIIHNAGNAQGTTNGLKSLSKWLL